MYTSKLRTFCLIIWIFCCTLCSEVDGKIQPFNNSKIISAFGLFRNKTPPTWERGQIVGYSLVSAMGELHFKPDSGGDSTIFKFQSLFNAIYLDKIPKWSKLTVGKTVLVELLPGNFHTGKIVARFNSTVADTNKRKVTVQISKRRKTFDYQNVRIKGMDACRYFEVDCDDQLEDCFQIYLTKWFPAPAQYRCSCKEGFKRHPAKKCLPLRAKNPLQEPFEEKSKKLTEEKKSNTGVMLGSIAGCIVLINALAVCLWGNARKEISSEERLRQAVIKEMEETLGVEKEEEQEQTVLSKIASCLRRLIQGPSKTAEDDFKIASKPIEIDTNMEIAQQWHIEMKHRNNNKTNIMTTADETRTDSTSVDLKLNENNIKIESIPFENDMDMDLGIGSDKTMESETTEYATTENVIKAALEAVENDDQIDSQTIEIDIRDDSTETVEGVETGLLKSENEITSDSTTTENTIETAENDSKMDSQKNVNAIKDDSTATKNDVHTGLETSENETRNGSTTTEHEGKLALVTLENDIKVDSKTIESYLNDSRATENDVETGLETSEKEDKMDSKTTEKVINDLTTENCVMTDLKRNKNDNKMDSQMIENEVTDDSTSDKRVNTGLKGHSTRKDMIENENIVDSTTTENVVETRLETSENETEMHSKKKDMTRRFDDN